VFSLTDKESFLIAVIVYGLSTIYSVFLWKRGFREHNRVTYALLGVAFMFHLLAMVQRGFSFHRCPVNNLYEALMFVSWTMVAAYLIIGLWSRLRFLGAFASPLLLAVGVFALMPALDPPYAGQPEFRSDWASLHASLILLSCGAFGLSSIAGLMYLTQEHDLKFHKMRAIFSLMPPIERLEKVIGWLLFAGFLLLTVGLSLSPLLLREKHDVYFKSDPILLYSLFVWLLYLGLLVMRWRFHQGGRRFAWGAVASFAFVLMTFWGMILLSPSHNPTP
jgi:HemX protein